MLRENVAMEHKPNIIYEDEQLLVIDKPTGLIVHGDGRTKETTLADWLLETNPTIRDIGESWQNDAGEVVARPGIVHRLDRETSGIMVVAKTHAMFETLKTAFQEHAVRKTYRAFVYDTMKESEGEIDRPIGKSKTDFRKWSAQPGSRGVQREAHTSWRLLSHVEEDGKTYAYLELAPTTGRTHQLRVHLKAIHHPLVCDSLYAPNRPCALGFSRLALHAHTLVLPDGVAKQTEFEAPLPDDFKHAEAL